MRRLGGSLRRAIDLLRRTPLHPQWLMGSRHPPPGLDEAVGLIVDIGAADRWIEQHVSPGARYLAVDFPSTAFQRYATRPDIFADAARLTLPCASVDAVVCLETLEHMADLESALSEIARVLKPGGRAFLSMPFLYPIHDVPFEHARLTEHGWSARLQRAQLRVTRLDPQGSALDVPGVAACLALTAPIAGRAAPVAALMSLVAVPAIMAINRVIATMRSFWPGWRAQCFGYAVEATRP